jgi:hypothetical protein
MTTDVMMIPESRREAVLARERLIACPSARRR